jgi:sugar lactone lactonase YvrE
MKKYQNHGCQSVQKQSFRGVKSVLGSAIVLLLLLVISCSDEEQIDQLKVTTIAGLNGPSTEFRGPQGIVRDVQGNLFVTDRYNHRIRKITPDGTVSTLAGSGVAGFADGTGTSSMFHFPSGIAIDKQGTLYVADHGNHRIRMITPDGEVSTYAGSGEKGFADGQDSFAKFNGPERIALDVRGNLYVTDFYNYRIRKITPQGIVSTFAGSGIRGNEDGSATEAQFTWLCGIAIDAQENIYVGDFSRIRKISPDGVVRSFSGAAGGGGEFADGNISNATFSNPAGFTIDCRGNIYVADYGNNRIRVITPEGIVSTLIKKYDRETGGDKIMYPMGITMDASNNIYITDFVKNIISKIESAQALEGCNGIP